MIGIEIQMMLGLAVGIFLMIFLVLKTKIHTFVALIIASAATGLIGGMMPGEVVSCITGGFGSTLGSIGIVIGLGVMTGRILEVSGAAERMAYTFMKAFGRGKEEWALAVTGLVVSIPIFADSGFVMGAMVFSYFNDSLFWIITRMLGITDVREQLRTWSVPTTLLWATGGILLFIAYAVFG